MTDSPQSKVGPNPSGLWLPPKERAQTSVTSKTNQHSLLTDTNGAGKSEPNSVKQLPDGTTVLTLLQQDGIPVECFNEFTDFVLALPTKLTRPWQRRFCITNSTAPRWSNEDRRAKSCHFASDFGAVLPAFSGGTCPGARDERPSRTRVRPH